MSYRKEIEILVKSYQNDLLAMEIVSMWVKNPSSASSQFGGRVFLEDMVWNLSHRYPKDVVIERVREVVLEINEFYTSRRNPEVVTEAFYEAYIEHGWEVSWAQIEHEIDKSPQVGHAMVPVFEYLWETGKIEPERSRGFDSRLPQTIDRILKDSPLSFLDLLKLGLFYKVTWVKKRT